MEFLIGAGSQIGTGKSINEDNCFVMVEQTKYGNACFAIVCDGVGGMDYGHKASDYVVRSMCNWFKMLTQVNFDITDELHEKINNEIMCINAELIRMGNQHGSKFGTTATGVLLVENQYFAFHVGDTRLYQNSSNFRCLTLDHTVIAAKIRNGQLTEEEAKQIREKPVLLQCIGITKELEIQNISGRVEREDVFLICSDGFYNRINFGELEDITDELKYMNQQEIQDIVNQMIEEVKVRGEEDDISVIFIKENS